MELELKKEEELLLCCARTRMEPEVEGRIKSLVKEDLDWNYLIHIAGRHNLKPLLYWQINQICPYDTPEVIMAELKEHYHENTQKNLMMYGELLKILKIFDKHFITAIPYKGPIMAIEEYNNLSLREFSDLDIYVPFNQVLKVKEILLTYGYDLDVQMDAPKLKKFIKTQRDLKFFNKSHGITLEIHWTFKSFYFSLPHNQMLCDKSKMIEHKINDITKMYPSPEDMFLIVCLHNASHRWGVMFWLCDVQQLITSHKLDWKIIMEKARKLVIERIILINLFLVKELWGLEIPTEVLYHSNLENIEKIVEEIKKNLFANLKTIGLLEEFLISIKLRERFIYGIKDVLRSIFLPGVCEWKSLSLPAPLWSLYYVYRPFNLIRRYK